MALREYSVAVARKDFAELINLVAYGKEQITISRRGKVVAAVVPIDDLELLNDYKAGHRPNRSTS